MVLGCHVIFSAYEFWLPNDPRGSWSDFVSGWKLLSFGSDTKIDTHLSFARKDIMLSTIIRTITNAHTE